MKPYCDDGGVTIYHGDCREVLPAIDAASVDLVWTDPPYGHNNNNNGDLAHRREAALGLRDTTEADARPIANDGPEANELVRWTFGEYARLLKPGCCCCCCCGGGGGGPDPQFARWSLWLDEHLEFKQAVVWRKPGMGMGWHYRRDYELVLVAQKGGAACKWNGGNAQSNVIETPGFSRGGNDMHPTPKPLSLPALFIEIHTDGGDLVLDPFMGSGTTLVAARQLGRRAIGIEIEERYCEVAAKRLAQAALPLWGEVT